MGFFYGLLGTRTYSQFSSSGYCALNVPDLLQPPLCSLIFSDPTEKFMQTIFVKLGKLKLFAHIHNDNGEKSVKVPQNLARKEIFGIYFQMFGKNPCI